MSAASAASPTTRMPTTIGAAMTPNRTRRVSSELKRRSHFHDLGFFRLDQFVDLVDVVVVDFLQVLLGVLDVVLGHAGQLLHRVTGMRPRMTDGDLAFL